MFDIIGQNKQHSLAPCYSLVVCRLLSTSHQLSSDGETGAVLLGQFKFDSLCVLDRLQRSGQVLWSHLKTDLIILRGHALHLVLIEEVSLQGGRTHRGSLMILRHAGSNTDPSPSHKPVCLLIKGKHVPELQLLPVTAHTTC